MVGRLIVIGLAGLFASFLEARELRWTHFGTRPLGMGNAFVAVADDYNALFYNPAGLTRLKTWDFEIINPALEASTQTVDAVGDFFSLFTSSGKSTSEIIDMLISHTGQPLRGSAYLTPHFVMPYFGVGVGLQGTLGLNVHRTVDSEVDLMGKAVIPIGFGFDAIKEVLSFGLNLKPVFGIGIDDEFDIELLSALSDSSKLADKFKGGYGVGVDAGMLFTPVKTMAPTIGISVMDIGGTTYTPLNLSSGGVAPSRPAERPAAINAGFSIKPYTSDVTYVLLAADAHMINQPVHYSHKLNLGSEFGFTSLFKLQAGLKEGYWTLGMQFDVGLINLRIASYAVDHSAVVGESNKIERRVVAQLKLLL